MRVRVSPEVFPRNGIDNAPSSLPLVAVMQGNYILLTTKHTSGSH